MPAGVEFGAELSVERKTYITKKKTKFYVDCVVSQRRKWPYLKKSPLWALTSVLVFVGNTSSNLHQYKREQRNLKFNLKTLC